MAWSIFQQGGGQGAAATWADDLLRLLGAPKTPGNEQVIYDWEVSEGGGGVYNPLNTGPAMYVGHPEWSGGSQYGGGAANYTSWQTGLLGSAYYIENKTGQTPGYKTIQQNLQTNQPVAARASIINSPWAASHYGGGASFSNAPFPGRKSALPGGGKITTAAAMQCPSFWVSFLSGPTGIGSYLECHAVNRVGIGGIASFLADPVDALERIGLVVFGALLVLLGIGILAMGPARQIANAPVPLARGISATQRIGRLGGPSKAVRQEKSRRMALAERNTSIGEKKVEIKELRERRLAANARPRQRRPVSEDIRAKRAARQRAKTTANSS